ncbi:MAG: S41 family peptidase [Sphingomonas sp.]|nr:S41 family peptidase [Sphingomonas sp.]
MNAFVLALLASPLPAAPLAQAATPPAVTLAQASEPFVKATAEAAVRTLATELEENFVFPDKGEAYAAMLRANLAAGEYASFGDANAFAQKVTDDLQAVHKDGHLRVRPFSAEQRARIQAGGNRGGAPEESAIAKSGWLADGVAYIDTRGFPGNEATVAEVRKFLASHRDAKTLIIDARKNRGGGLDEMDLIFSEIFAAPTTLVAMDIRQAVEEKNGTPFGDLATLRKVSGPETIIRREHFVTPPVGQGGLRDAKVYLLISKNTFSAAEHLSLSLKRTKRATLIGEATGGGAHFGGGVPLGESYGAFIPVGRTFDPDTGQSWEGIGVKPDVEVPADRALDEALKLAGVNKSAEVALAALK